MWGMLYQALRWFIQPTPANKNEKDQPPPLEQQLAHAEAEVERIKHAKDDGPFYEEDRGNDTGRDS